LREADRDNNKKAKKPVDPGLRRLYLWCVLFMLVAVAGFLTEMPYRIYNKLHPRSPAEQIKQLGINDPYALTKHVRIGSADYDIPMGYFIRAVPFYTQDINTYLAIHRPDFGILPMNENRMWERGKSEDVVRMLSRDRGASISVSEMLPHRIKKTRRSVLDREKLFGLDVYILPSGVVDEQMGRLYTYSENGRVVTLIECSQKIDNTSLERCTHFFSDGFLVHHTSYRYSVLSEWRDVQQRTCALFDTFRARAKEKNYAAAVIPEDKISPHVLELRNSPRKENSYQGETSCRN